MRSWPLFEFVSSNITLFFITVLGSQGYSCMILTVPCYGFKGAVACDFCLFFHGLFILISSVIHAIVLYF